MRGWSALRGVLEIQRGALFPWVPVALATGIGGYFALPDEPRLPVLASLTAAALVLALLAWWLAALRPLLVALALIAAGVVLAAERSRHVAAPVLSFRYYGAVEGRVVQIDRSSSDALRLTLDRLRLDKVPPWRTPARVRIALHGPDQELPEPGARIRIIAGLAPPGGPVAPGGFDFRRLAWFDRLGAVGYSRKGFDLLAPPPSGADLAFTRLRLRLSAAIRARLPGQPGGFAATVLTGDRSGLSPATQSDLRAANLSHLLSISGLHMVLLTGTVFAAVRLVLVLIPGLGLRLPARKIAAGAALATGLFYYLLAGRQVPAERAWVMIAVVFGAVLVDRRAISLRSVALAALVVLLMRPESLVTPGFQMSFAATVALVAAFGGLRRWTGPRAPAWAAPALTMLVSSAVAGVATAPFAAAHFNRIADYGLLANLLTVPLMGLVVMPAGVAAMVLAPFGLDGIAFWLMDWPIRWILGVAHHVAAMRGAVTPVVAPSPAVLPLIALGGLVLVLWQGRWLRLGGLAPLTLGLALWAATDRPALLVSPDGRLLGLMTQAGRALSKPTGQGFAAANWLEDDGDAAGQAAAASPAGARPCRRRGRRPRRRPQGPADLRPGCRGPRGCGLRRCRSGDPDGRGARRPATRLPALRSPAPAGDRCTCGLGRCRPGADRDRRRALGPSPLGPATPPAARHHAAPAGAIRRQRPGRRLIPAAARSQRFRRFGRAAPDKDRHGKGSTRKGPRGRARPGQSEERNPTCAPLIGARFYTILDYPHRLSPKCGRNEALRERPMLIDTHLHVIDRRRLRYPWLAGTALDRDWSFADWQVTARRTGISHALHMEVDVAPDDIDAETGFVAGMMAGSPMMLGAVSAARPERPDFRDWLARLDRRVVRGLRRILHQVPDQVSQAPAFRAGVRAMGEAGLPFDLCVRADQLHLAADLVDACPQTRFVLDHCGNPEVGRDGYAAWAGPLAELARRGNVNAKLSGLLAQTGPDWSVETLRPYVEHLIGAFGWDRVVWGSDSPVVTLGGSLSDWVAATRALVEPCSEGERARLYHRNAMRIWGLELDAPAGLA